MDTPRLLLGPLLRYVGHHDATVWVETDRACTVTVEATERRSAGPQDVIRDVAGAPIAAMSVAADAVARGPVGHTGHTSHGDDSAGGTRNVESASVEPVELSDEAALVESDGAADRIVSEPTWSVHGHHYALVQLTGLAEDSVYVYSVTLDDRRVWPERGTSYPPSVIRTLGGHGSLRLSFGSCRRAAPFDDEGLREVGVDALAAMADRMRTLNYDQWPDALLMVGDQVYADEPSPELVDRLVEAHRDPPPGREEIAGEVWDYEEYTWLYHESWSPEPVRWLLSTVPSCMLLDDHDLRDDWNTSIQWREEVTQAEWWRDRVVGAFASYWVYQHLGNLSPADLATDAMFAMVRRAQDDAARTAALDDFAWRSDAEVGSARWSFVRDYGDEETTIRLVAIDCRASRDLDPEHRVMVDDREWAWVVEQATARPEGRPITHLLLAATLPLMLPRAIHHIEGWDEAAVGGRYGDRVADLAEWLRKLVDLEHWAAFRVSFHRVVDLLRRVCTTDDPPASVLFLSGDVHCSYVATGQLADTDHPRTTIRQLTMSPFRNPLPFPLRIINQLAERPQVRTVLRRLSAAAGVEDTGLNWALTSGPWFSNGLMTVILDHRQARLEVDHGYAEGLRQRLRRTATHDLTGEVSPPARPAS